MKKHLLNIQLIAICFFACSSLQAQERYFDEMFDSVTVTGGVHFATNISVECILLDDCDVANTPQPVDLLMDVYEPADDTAAVRPVIILAHRGDYLPQYLNMEPYGARNDFALVEMCTRFAKMGYVAISMDYRLGWNPLSDDEIELRSTVIQAVYRIIQDMRTCVRYVRKHAAEDGNTFRFDTDRIAVGGMDAAGWAAEGVANLKNVIQSYLPEFTNLSTGIPFLVPDFFGDPYGIDTAELNIPNHPTYSSDVNVVIDVEGGTGNISWIEAGDPPIIAFMHEDKWDQVGIRDVTLDGNKIIVSAAFPDTIIHTSNALGNQDIFSELNDDLGILARQRNGGLNGLFLYHTEGMEGSVDCDGDPTTPETNYGSNIYAWNWYDEPTYGFVLGNILGHPAPAVAICEYNTSEGTPNTYESAEPYIDTLMEYMKCRLAVAMDLPLAVSCGVANNVDNSLKPAINFKAYPNPADGKIRLEADQALREVALYDLNGRLVFEQKNWKENSIVVSTTDLAIGMYVAKITLDNGVVSEKISVNR